MLSFKDLNKNRNKKYILLIGLLSVVTIIVFVYSYTRSLLICAIAIAFFLGVSILIFILTKPNRLDNRILASGVSQIDRMSGDQFEEYMLVYFINQGYKGTLTRITGDFGADLLIEKDGKKIAVQTKRWSYTVGISAIQQVVAAIKYYKADYGMVITTNYFSPNAEALAKSNGIILWDRGFIVRNTCKIPLLNWISDNAGETVCPICKSQLVAKKWEFGTIICCKNYPTCRYIKTT